VHHRLGIVIGGSAYPDVAAAQPRAWAGHVALREQGLEARSVPIVLQLDHINGRRTDNRLENLRILCPNCHAQTETWCGKNRRPGPPR
jgi:hypothetical protein